MRRMVWALAGLVALVLVAMAYVRLAPIDPGRWHTDPASGVVAGEPGHFRVCEGGDRPAVPGGSEALERLAVIAAATPRTRRLAGSPAEGRITWVTRSLVWGFPDLTTAALVQTASGPAICIHARLRFGRDDLGVNRARVERWLKALDSQHA